MSNRSSDDARSSADQEVLNQILEMIRDLKFGSLEIVVHEGRIVQIEKREKIRLNLSKRN